MNLHWLKMVSVFAFCLAFRLLPFRPPNVEPILASQMPLARHGGGFAGFLFGILSILLYDIITGTLGPWTLITASAYGMLGAFAAFYFKFKSDFGNSLKSDLGTRRHYVYFAIVGTLFYDAATGLTVGPLFFHQPFLAALTGQIPFTLMHLLGNVGFALTLSPIVEKWVLASEFGERGKHKPIKTQSPDKTQNSKGANHIPDTLLYPV